MFVGVRLVWQQLLGEEDNKLGILSTHFFFRFRSGDRTLHIKAYFFLMQSKVLLYETGERWRSATWLGWKMKIPVVDHLPRGNFWVHFLSQGKGILSSSYIDKKMLCFEGMLTSCLQEMKLDSPQNKSVSYSIRWRQCVSEVWPVQKTKLSPFFFVHWAAVATKLKENGSQTSLYEVSHGLERYQWILSLDQKFFHIDGKLT